MAPTFTMTSTYAPSCPVSVSTRTDPPDYGTPTSILSLAVPLTVTLICWPFCGGSGVIWMSSM